jgi:hypothetical protein
MPAKPAPNNITYRAGAGTFIATQWNKQIPSHFASIVRREGLTERVKNQCKSKKFM